MKALGWLTSYLEDLFYYARRVRKFLGRVLRWPLRRLGILTPSDSKLLIEVLARGITSVDRLDKKIDLVVETMQRMVEEAGLSGERLDAYDRAWSAIGASAEVAKVETSGDQS